MKKLFWLIVILAVAVFVFAYVKNKYRVPQETPAPVVVEERNEYKQPIDMTTEIFNRWCELNPSLCQSCLENPAKCDK